MVINFAMPRLMPGNVLGMFASDAMKLTEEARQAAAKRFGLDVPMAEQFTHYFINAFKGDFGRSFVSYPKPVIDMIGEALPWTLMIIFSSTILQALIAYMLGVSAAWKAGSKKDEMIQTVSLVILSAPMFWTAMVLLYIFGFRLGWFPLSGAYSAGVTYKNAFGHVMDIIRHAVLPTLTLTISSYAIYQLILRNTMVSVIKELYIRTAEAKGLSEWRIKHRHAARNALLPMVTFLGIGFAVSVGSSVYIETVFSYPGIGKLIYEAVSNRDYPVLQGCFFFFSLIVIAMNFLVDIIYQFLDPRLRT